MSGVWDPLRAELDTDPPWDVGAVGTSYIVCSTPRSGSGLLCRGLASTGLAGAPAEYFNRMQRGPLERRWGAGPGLAEYVRALRAHRTSAAGVFGVKLHWDQLESLRAEALGVAAAEPPFECSADFLEALVPAAHYVHMLRRDVDRQAVSYWTALLQRVWSVQAGSAPPQTTAVRYSYAGIERCRRAILTSEVHWDRFFRFNDIDPELVVYEELAHDHAATVAAVLAGILATPLEAVLVPTPSSSRQAGARSDELYARFVRDRARRGVDVSPSRTRRIARFLLHRR